MINHSFIIAVAMGVCFAGAAAFNIDTKRYAIAAFCALLSLAWFIEAAVSDVANVLHHP